MKKIPQDGPMDLCRICLDSVCASRSRGTSRAFAFGVSQKLLGVVGCVFDSGWSPNFLAERPNLVDEV